MAPKSETKTDAIRLMSTETDFERSGISGRTCTKDAAPRQEEMPAEVHQELLAAIARDEIAYIVFSYRTPIAWVHRNGAVNLPEIKYSRSTTTHQNWVRQAFGDRVNRPGDWDGQDDTQPTQEPQAPASISPTRYAELGEDDLIELAVQGLDKLFGDDPEAGWEADPEIFSSLDAVLRSLKARREATAPARRRIGEYLRHVAINEVAYERTKDSAYSNAKAPRDIVDEIRADAYAATARLRLTDLSQVVEPTVRDSQREFYAQQATIQSGLDTDKLPEKQAALVPCVARGHITSHGDGRYSGERGCTCHLLDGRTMNALVKRDFIGIRQGLGYRANGTLMLIRPKTA
jgi:hypothetical protein